MAVSLTRIFTRIGLFSRGYGDLVSLMGGTTTSTVTSNASWQTRGTSIETELASAPALSEYFDPWSIINSWRSTQGGLFSQLQNGLHNLVIETVHADTPLQQKTITAALTELFRQMRASSDDIDAMTVSAGAQTALGSPTGTPSIVVTVKTPLGEVAQTAFAEVLRFTTVTDSYTNATARQEQMTVAGKVAVPYTAYNWPQGSGAAGSITLVDAQLNNSGGNKLYDSDFENYDTTNYPRNWVILTGAVTTNVLAGGAGYTQSNSVKFLGDAGGTLTKIYQPFDTTATSVAGTGGTPATLKPSTRYAINLFTKVSSVPGAGVLRIALTDGSNTVVNDDFGTANSFNIDLTAETTDWNDNNGVFITPAATPSTGYRLQIGLTTAISDTVSVFIDDIALTEMTELYKGGPCVAAFAGATKVVIGDKWTSTISNNFTTADFALWLERWFNLRDKGLQAPYDTGGTESIADSLIV